MAKHIEAGEVTKANARVRRSTPQIVGTAREIASSTGNIRKVFSNKAFLAGNNRLSLQNGATAILHDAAYRPENQLTANEKIGIVRAGISKKDLEGLKETARLDYSELAKLLFVTRATLINKKKEEKFNTGLSERILALADIYSYGYEVFEDEDRFNRWIFRPNHALGGQAPFDLMDNQFGRRR